ncbi:MAG: DNA methylase [Phycisphaeraceae bacterium]|nr:DNA methylase [Phycisphaeraceae bacterium]
MTTPYYEDERATLHNAEALATLRELPTASVDAVITDPPYSSGGAMRGDRQQPAEKKYRGWSQNSDGSSKAPTSTYAGFTGDTRDQRGYLVWSSIWMTECQRILKPGGTFAVFTDWRQLPTTTDAVQAAGLVWRAVAVWDKGIGRPVKGRFRNHVEYVVWATNGPHSSPQDVYPSTVLRHTPPTSSRRVHLTEKPVGVISDLLTLIPAGSVVLDPFAGSATTGVAALEAGHRFIGVEMSEHYAEVSANRLRTVTQGCRDDGGQDAIDFGESA